VYLVTAEYRVCLRSLLSDCFDYKVTGGVCLLSCEYYCRSLQSTQKSKTRKEPTKYTKK